MTLSHPFPVCLFAESALESVSFDRGTLWLVAGFLMLGWALARLTISRRKKAIRQRGESRETQRRLDSVKKTALPLSDAPPETQRWQVAMFDLQRELTGDLDTRIAVVQSLIRHADQRIATLQELERRQQAK
ncbi:hypothetical protein [Rhodopirellula sp. P2]|uniref:hypothetical protein n=1 Tax=Rhodopirellula sp. P2 TaxID=2127060 RepID=UPI00236870FF|nr:hypothetical protein [Rhodopirellula sp. P2]WDQ15855.1 hypothetical protein PSR62_19760 [Rhodopirellula sp. P2]